MKRRKQQLSRDWMGFITSLSGRKEIMKLVHDELTSIKCITGSACVNIDFILDSIAEKLGMNDEDYRLFSYPLKQLVKHWKDELSPQIENIHQIPLIF
jgi:hypothetical protein